MPIIGLKMTSLASHRSVAGPGGVSEWAQRVDFHDTDQSVRKDHQIITVDGFVPTFVA